MKRVAAVACLAVLVMSVAPTARGALLEGASNCPATIDPAAFASENDLRAMNQVEADFGARPTASPNHEAFIDWVDSQLGSIAGLERADLPITIDRQMETGASLTVTTPAGTVPLPVAGAVPYALASPDGVSAPLVYVPTGTAINTVDVAGKIVVRDSPPGMIQNALFFAVGYYVHDPDRSMDHAGNYERDWLNAAQRITDLTQAQDAGAAGLVLVHQLPRDQVRDSYAPYPGVFWKIPAVYLGVDEGTQLEQLIASGEAQTAHIAVTATRDPQAPTRTLIARLPGVSNERIVVESHTDGMNAVWDNGPVALLAMANYFAALPLECRPRTIEFVFTTGHLYLSRSGVHQYAKILDDEYDKGTVALVVALEHLGAQEYVATPRTDGPGRRLEPSGKSEMFAIFSIESPLLVGALTNQVVAHDLRRSWILRGADAPQAGFPPHRSFGGEGGPYREQIVPTIAAITGPWTLFDPAFGMELVDFALMRRQAMAFGDVILSVADKPRELIAGADTVYRAGRTLTTQESSAGELAATMPYCSLMTLQSMVAPP